MNRWVGIVFFFILPSVCVLANESKIDSYLKMLKKHPDTIGIKGDYERGEIEIVSTPKRILEIQDLQKMRLKKKGLSEEAAFESSRVGIVFKDNYLMVVRDAVVFPTGAEGTYDRLVWMKGLKDGMPGIAVLPILPDGRVILNLTYRHAIRSWELEIP